MSIYLREGRIRHAHVRGHPTGIPDDYVDILSEGSPLDIDPYYDPFEDPFRFIPTDKPKEIDDLAGRGRPPPVGAPGASVDISASPVPGLPTDGFGGLVGSGTPDYPAGRSPTAGIEVRVLEQWQIRGAEDLLCTQWDRTVWPVGSGPHPVTDTHPNCRCVRVPYAESHVVRVLSQSRQTGRSLGDRIGRPYTWQAPR